MVSITAVPGGSIASVFGGENKALPRDYYAMIFLSIASILDTIVECFESRMGASVPVPHLD